MNGSSWKSPGLAAAVLFAAATPLLAQTPWIHVEVHEAGDDASHVKVNLPLSLVEVAIDAAPDKILREGRIRFHDDDFDDVNVEDLRRMWKELRATGDGELVSVEKEDATVSVRRQGDLVLVKVEDRKGASKKDATKNATVHVQVPVSVVDALLSGEGQELNVKDAVTALKSLRGDIVSVDDGGDRVRIWIDEKD